MAVSRRQLLVLGALLASLALVHPASAQPTKIYRVGFVAAVTPQSEISGSEPSNRALRAFIGELRASGYVIGRNLVFDIRSLEGRLDRAQAVVADMVGLKPDAIFFPGDILVAPALQVGGSIPLVTLFGAGVVETGWVQSFARPGGRVTGLVVDVDAGVEAKRLEMLMEIAPKARRIAFLGVQQGWD